MIRIDELIVKIDGKIILNKIQHCFSEFDIHGIVGRNGAGKTTLFNTLSCIHKPISGNATYKNLPITYHDVGYLEATNFFYSRITGNEYLNIFEQTNNDFNINILNDILHIPLDDLIETYSSGMKKKLALLGLIKQDKAIYLLDEPFNNLDIESIIILKQIIRNLKRKKHTIIISSHIIETLTPICDYIHIMENGRLTKTYKKENFETVKDELFNNFTQSVKQIVDKSV